MEIYELFKNTDYKFMIYYYILFIIILIFGKLYNQDIRYYFIMIIIYIILIYFIQISWYNSHNVDKSYDDHIINQLKLNDLEEINKENKIVKYLHDNVYISYYSNEYYNKLKLLLNDYLIIYNHIKQNIDILHNKSSIKGNKLSINQKRLLFRDMNNLRNIIINHYDSLIHILPNNNRIINKYNEMYKILIIILNYYYYDIINNNKDIDNLIETHFINSYNFNDKYDYLLD